MDHNTSKLFIEINDKRTLQELARLIADSFNIKLSRARERLSDALALNSFNHAIGNIKQGREIRVNIDSFAKELQISLKKYHNIDIDISDNFIDKLSYYCHDVFDECTFQGFMLYSFFITDQTLPLSATIHFIKEYDEEIDLLDGYLHESLSSGIVSPELSKSMDKYLSIIRRAKNDNKNWTFHSSNNRFGKLSCLNSYRDNVIAKKHSKLMHVYVVMIAYTGDDWPDDVKVELSHYENATNKTQAGQQTVYLADAFEPLDSMLIDDDCCSSIRFRTSFSSFEQIQYANRIDSHTFQNGRLPSAYDLHSYEDCKLPSSVFIDSWLQLKTFTKDIFNTDRYSTPFNDAEEYDVEDVAKSSVLLAGIPIVKMGDPLTIEQQHAIGKDIRNGFCALQSNSDVLSTSKLISVNGSQRNLFIDDELILNALGEMMASYTASNPAKHFEYICPSDNDYVVFSNTSIYRPLGRDSHILNSTMEKSHFGIHDTNFFSLSNILDGFNKNRKKEITMLGCYQDNLAKEKSYGIADNGDSFYFSKFNNHYELEFAPQYEIFPRCFYYTLNWSDFLNTLALEACSNVYLIKCDNDDDAYVNFYLIGYDEKQQCVFNVVYYDDSITELSESTFEQERLFLETIQSKIKGEIKDVLLEGYCISNDDGMSHSIFGVSKEDLLLKMFNDVRWST